MSDNNLEIKHENAEIISDTSHIEGTAQVEHKISNETKAVPDLSTTPVTLPPAPQLVVEPVSNIESFNTVANVSNVNVSNVNVSNVNVSNVIAENTTSFVVATLPSSLVNGALSGIDTIIANAKATLDADILAAQTKAKNTVAASVATAKSIIAEIENWLATAPGNIQVVESSITNVGVGISNIVTNSNGFIGTVKGDINIIGSDINSIESDIIKVTNVIITDAKDVVSVPVKAVNSVESGTKTVVHDSENVFEKIKTFWDKL